MGKARIYGKATAYTPNKRRDLRYIKKNARNRERAMPSLVAGLKNERRIEHEQLRNGEQTGV